MNTSAAIVTILGFMALSGVAAECRSDASLTADTCSETLEAIARQQLEDESYGDESLLLQQTVRALQVSLPAPEPEQAWPEVVQSMSGNTDVNNKICRQHQAAVYDMLLNAFQMVVFCGAVLLLIGRMTDYYLTSVFAFFEYYPQRVRDKMVLSCIHLPVKVVLMATMFKPAVQAVANIGTDFCYDEEQEKCIMGFWIPMVGGMYTFEFGYRHAMEWEILVHHIASAVAFFQNYANVSLFSLRVPLLVVWFYGQAVIYTFLTHVASLYYRLGRDSTCVQILYCSGAAVVAMVYPICSFLVFLWNQRQATLPRSYKLQNVFIMCVGVLPEYICTLKDLWSIYWRARACIAHKNSTSQQLEEQHMESTGDGQHKFAYLLHGPACSFPDDIWNGSVFMENG